MTSSPRPIYKVPDFISEELFPFWEVPSFVGNNLQEMIEISTANFKQFKGFICNATIINPINGLKADVKALFDTGATVTSLSPNLISRLALIKKGDYSYSAVGGKRNSSKYEATVQ